MLVEAHLHARQRPAVGGEPLVLGVVEQATGDRRVLGAPVGAEHLHPQLGGPLGDGDRHGRAAEAGEGHQGQVLVGEVGVVEQAGQEVRGAAADAQAVGQHQAQHLARVPHVDEVHRPVAQQRDDEGVEHPDEVADRGAGDLRRPAEGEHVVELAGLAAQRAVRVHHALRVAGGARGEADDGRGVGCDRGRAGHGLAVEQVGERGGARREGAGRGVAHHQPVRHRVGGPARPGRRPGGRCGRSGRRSPRPWGGWRPGCTRPPWRRRSGRSARRRPRGRPRPRRRCRPRPSWAAGGRPRRPARRPGRAASPPAPARPGRRRRTCPTRGGPSTAPGRPPRPGGRGRPPPCRRGRRRSTSPRPRTVPPGRAVRSAAASAAGRPSESPRRSPPRRARTVTLADSRWRAALPE